MDVVKDNFVHVQKQRGGQQKQSAACKTSKVKDGHKNGTRFGEECHMTCLGLKLKV